MEHEWQNFASLILYSRALGLGKGGGQLLRNCR